MFLCRESATCSQGPSPLLVSPERDPGKQIMQCLPWPGPAEDTSQSWETACLALAGAHEVYLNPCGFLLTLQQAPAESPGRSFPWEHPAQAIEAKHPAKTAQQVRALFASVSLSVRVISSRPGPFFPSSPCPTPYISG